MKDIYSIGCCEICKREKEPLKNNICSICHEKKRISPEIPEFMKEMFGGFYDR